MSSKEAQELQSVELELGLNLLQSIRVTLESSLNLKMSGSPMGMDGNLTSMIAVCQWDILQEHPLTYFDFS